MVGRGSAEGGGTITGYRGGNAVYLAMTALDRGYADPRWAGYRQIREAGGHVRNGEKGTPISPGTPKTRPLRLLSR